MKTKKITKKLSLNKSTVSTLDQAYQQAVKAGYYATALWTGCRTWHPECKTMPKYNCRLCSQPGSICV